MDVPLISVIVPIYNVERYVRKCLDSLVDQTMKEIEVICIDDGSTDKSGKIADEFAKEDERFRVIHTENRGLSAARNRGIDEARAEWIMFVDSDDWVDKDFCKIPYEAALENQVDMVIFDYFQTSENGLQKKLKLKKLKSGMLSQEEAVDIAGAVWCKIYKKRLFNDIRFPEGHAYEDVAITPDLVYRANRIIRVENRLYYYRNRRESISHSSTWERDRLLMSEYRYNKLIDYGYPQMKAKAHLYGAALRCLGRIEQQDGELYEKASSVLWAVKGIPAFLTIKEKIMFCIWKANKDLYQKIYRIAAKLQFDYR